MLQEWMNHLQVIMLLSVDDSSGGGVGRAYYFHIVNTVV